MPITWPDNYADQRVEIVNIRARFDALDRIFSPATHIGTAKPTESDITAAWFNKLGKAITPVDNSYTLWFNPQTLVIENLYYKLSSLQSGHSNLMTEVRTSQIVLLDSFFVDHGDTPVAFWDATIDPDYHNILIISNTRSTNATTGTLVIRPNSNGGAIYQRAAVYLNNTPAFTSLVAENSTSHFKNIPGINAEPGLFTNVVLSLYWPFAPEVAHARSGFEMSVVNINDLDAALDVNVAFGGWSFNDVTLDITVIRFDPTLNFDKGTWIYIFGVNPINPS